MPNYDNWVYLWCENYGKYYSALTTFYCFAGVMDTKHKNNRLNINYV